MSVLAVHGCSWTASTNTGSWDWIGINSGWSGTGNGTVNYFLLANNTGSTRTGTLAISGQTFTITQQPKGCTYSISPNSKRWIQEGSGSVDVNCGQLLVDGFDQFRELGLDRDRFRMEWHRKWVVNYFLLPNNSSKTREDAYHCRSNLCGDTGR